MGEALALILKTYILKRLRGDYANQYILFVGIAREKTQSEWTL